MPVTHNTTTRSDVKGDNKKSRNLPSDNKIFDSDEKFKKPVTFQSCGFGQKVNDAKSVFSEDTTTNSNSSPQSSPRLESPPVQRTKRLIAREITIERLDSGINVTSYKDAGFPTSKPEELGMSSLTKTAEKNSDASSEVDCKVEEIKIHRSPPSVQSKEELPFKQVKLRNTKLQIEKQLSSDSLKSEELKTGVCDPDLRRISRKISSERFERLMFDFERGVPTEAAPRRGSEHSDHIELQQKARELSNLQKTETPVITKKNKEESIFREGLKVSDFVKQVNKMNPELSEPPKWKVQQKVNKSHTSSASSSIVGGDNLYQGIPGEVEEEEKAHDADLEDDDIYEKVNLQGQ